MLELDKFIKITFILLFSVQINNCYSWNNSTRYRRQVDEDCFKCHVSGECIADDKECDGTVDCRDGSDENDCSKIRCPRYSFQCKYGACINRQLICDGKSDCRDGSDEETPECKTTAALKCQNDQFQCDSGQCIPEEKRCDGVAQCTDNSDETSKTCSAMKCPNFAFKCAYGACVRGDSKCNGYKDCFDNSDEDPKICQKEVVTDKPTLRPPVTQIMGGCALPSHPKRGQWSLFGDQPLQPGDKVQPGSLITFKCNKDYVFKGTDIIYCLNDGSWSNSVGVCEKLCTSLSNTTSTTVICTKGYTLADCAHPDEGTRAEFYCEPFYENRESISTLRVCHEGSWDKPRHRCEPICGLKTGRAETLIVGGNNATEGDYPWHAGLYYNAVTPPRYLCGGSLISHNIVISAAHCVTDLKSGSLLSKDIFTIAVGKYYSKYDDPRDREAQYTRLKKIYILPSWRGETLLYQADIAILITDEILQLSRRVQPVCMDYDGRVTQLVLQNPNPIGVVVGWGAGTEVGSSTQILKEVTLPYIQNDKCRQRLPEDFQPYLNFDKFCSGFMNQSTSVCTGDSGGGLVFRNPRSGRYYLTGIVSLSPKSDSGGCDQNQYSLFTNVSQYTRNIVERAAYHSVPF